MSRYITTWRDNSGKKHVEVFTAENYLDYTSQIAKLNVDLVNVKSRLLSNEAK